MKIFLLILEVLFVGFMIYRYTGRRKKYGRGFFSWSFVKLIGAAITVCIFNLFIIIGSITGWGYIPDMLFLIFVIIELTLGSM